jgi:hypothetical protein
LRDFIFSRELGRLDPVESRGLRSTIQASNHPCILQGESDAASSGAKKGGTSVLDEVARCKPKKKVPLLIATRPCVGSRGSIWNLTEITDGTLYAQDRGSGPGMGKRSQHMGDVVYIFGVIVFFILCALYVAALDRM